MKRPTSISLFLSEDQAGWSWLISSTLETTSDCSKKSLALDRSLSELQAESCKRIKQAMTLQDLRLCGEWLLASFLPKQIVEILIPALGCELTFIVPSQQADIPFELCYLPEYGFIGELFRIGTVIAGSMTESGTNNHWCREPAILFVITSSESVPAAYLEYEQQRNLLRSCGFATSAIASDENTIERILASIEQNALVHFAGHSFSMDATSASDSWMIDERHSFSVTQLQPLSKAPSIPQLIFSNSCDAGIYGTHSASGIAGSFLKLGIKLFIGPATTINDLEAFTFSRLFYQHLFKSSAARRKPAYALANARNEMLQSHPGSITPLIYRFFGNPGYALQLNHRQNHRFHLLCALFIGLCIIALTSAIVLHGRVVASHRELIFYLSPDTRDEFQTISRDYISDVFYKAGYLVKNRTAETAALQQTQFSEALKCKHKPTAVIISTVDSTSFKEELIQQARGRGIHILAYDRKITGSQLDFTAVSNAVGIGDSAAHQVAQLLRTRFKSPEPRGTILQICGDQWDSYSREIQQGFDAAIATRFRDIECITKSVPWQNESAVEYYIKQYVDKKDIDLIFIHSAIFAQPVISALKQLGKQQDEIMLVSSNGAPQGLKLIRQGWERVEIEQPLYAQVNGMVRFLTMMREGIQPTAPCTTGIDNYRSVLTRQPWGLNLEIDGSVITRNNCETPTLWGNHPNSVRKMFLRWWYLFLATIAS